MDFRLLGALEVVGDDGREIALRAGRQRALLALLALRANELVSSDVLVEELWGESPPPTALQMLRNQVSELRRALGANGTLETRGSGYRLRIGEGERDVDRFEALLARGRARLGDDPAGAAESLREALGLWRGPALADLAYEPFVATEARRLEEARVVALEQLIEAELALGHHAEVVGQLEALIGEHPYRERLRAQLMLALYRCDRQADALQAYHDARRTLVEEVGIEPVERLRELEAAILAHEPSLAAPASAEIEGHAAAFPLPPVLLRVPWTGFIGRIAERERLRAAWTQAQQGRTLLLISGEAGIGKTRLAAHLAREVADEGAIVLYGRAGEDVGLPYEPWRQALSHAVQWCPDALLRVHVSRYRGELLRLAPGLGDRLQAVPEPRESDPQTERHLLFGAVLGLLQQLARIAPLLLVLDDLQWADDQTIALLRHTQLAAPADLRLLVMATCRDEETTASRPLVPLLADLGRELDEERRVALAGLDVGETRALMEAMAGDTLDDAATTLARDLHLRTSGNPFFLKQLVRDLAESGALRRDPEGRWTTGDAPLGVPRRVREVIRGRVARLGPDAERLLGAAAVIGREFDLALLGHVGGVPEDAAIDALDAACAGRLLSESADRPGSYMFVHALVREALEEHLGPGRRARLHRRIAEALGELGGAPPGEVARHWLAAGPGARRQALAAAGVAGRAALTDLAPGEAVRWFETGLELHRELAGAPGADRRELLLGLGEAQSHVGSADFRETLLEAAEDARAVGDRERLARAALANTRGVFSSGGFVDEERVQVLEAALRHTDRDDPYRPRLLSLLAGELLWHPDHGRRRALSDEAIALARAHGDTSALAYALRWRVLAVWWPETLPDRMRTTAELLSLTERLGDPLQRFWALHYRATTVVQAGDVVEADAHLREARALLRGLHYRRLEFVLAAEEGWRAQLAGALDVAEASAERAATIGSEAGEPDALGLYAGQLGPIRWHQGRLAEEIDLLESIADAVPGVAVFRAMHALAEVEAGRGDQARARIEALARERFASIPADPVQLGAWSLWAEVAARVRSVAAAEPLLARLAPLRDQVVLDTLGTLGVVSRAAALVAGLLGRWDEADAHFAHALERHERMGASSLAARTRLEWGFVLAGQAGGERRTRARDALTRAAADARSHRLPFLEERARELIARVDADAAEPARG